MKKRIKNNIFVFIIGLFAVVAIFGNYGLKWLDQQVIERLMPAANIENVIFGADLPDPIIYASDPAQIN